MTIVATVAPEQATGKVAQVYARMEKAFGRVPNAVRLFSASPDLLELGAAQNGYYMTHPTLGFPLLAFVRMLVSQQKECAYCIGFNERLLMDRAGVTPEQIAAAKADPAQAPLSEKDRAMLLFVLKGMAAPKSITSADLDALRALGWDDRDMVDGLFHGARNAAVDVLFDAFQIENDW